MKGAKRNASDDLAPPKKMVKMNKGHWTQGLKRSLEKNECIIKKTELVTVIQDKFPKAKHHYLVVHANIPSIHYLRKVHVDIIKHMIAVGHEVVSNIKRDDVYDFKMGFHAIPSMDLLHMHLISNDFNSPCLKNKKHWNSFTTSFFISADSLIKQLEENGKIEIDTGQYEDILKRDLICHRCREKPKNMPTLKDHIKSHL